MATKLATRYKQERFAAEYLVDLNATAAYQRAIRPEASLVVAATEGGKLLRTPYVQELVQTARARLIERTQVTSERVILELARIAFIDPREVFEWGPSGVRLRPSHELTPDAAAVVASVKHKRRTHADKDGNTSTSHEVEIKLADKIAALDKLARHLGLYKPEEVNVNVSGGVLLVPAAPDPAAWALAASAQQQRLLGKGSGEG